MSDASADAGLWLAGAFPEASRVGELLRERGCTVAVAESCTGGLLGAVITAVPGASAYLVGGVIAYANQAKVDQLAVAPELIEEHGAVSVEVALAMAREVRRRFGADLGVGVTGVAGPQTDEDGKPAGLVFVAVVDPGGERVERLDRDRGREGNRAAAVRTALRLLTEAV